MSRTRRAVATVEGRGRGRRAVAGAAVGLVLVAGYVVAARWTTGASPIGMRPVFETFGPPPPYRYVDPPKDVAATNVKPQPIKMTVELSAKGSAGKAGDVDASQAIVNLPDGAIAPHPPDTSVSLTAVPLSPAGEPPPPAGMLLAGNVYRVTATYQPSGTPVPSLAIAGNMILRYPTTPRATTLLYSPDGKQAWQPLKTLDFGGSNQLGGDLAAFGDFVLAGPPGTHGNASGGSGFPVSAVVGAGLGGLALLLVVAATVTRRRRDTTAAPARGGSGPAKRRGGAAPKGAKRRK